MKGLLVIALVLFITIHGIGSGLTRLSRKDHPIPIPNLNKVKTLNRNPNKTLNTHQSLLVQKDRITNLNDMFKFLNWVASKPKPKSVATSLYLVPEKSMQKPLNEKPFSERMEKLKSDFLLKLKKTNHVIKD